MDNAAAVPLYRISAAAAVAIVGLIPVQMAAFAAWPTPGTATDAFALFRRSALGGLAAFDLLLIASWTLSVIVFFGLYAVLRGRAPLRMAAALAFELVAFASYLSSNTAFSLLSLSERHALAASDAERTALLGAGEAMLALYTGTAFNVGYVLAGVAALLLGHAMLSTRVFGRKTAAAVLVYALLQVPPTAGSLGMALAVLSLVPMVGWLLSAARQLTRLADVGHSGRGGALVSEGS